MVALLGLLGAPVVAERQMVCRYTGQVIAGCDEGSAPASSLVCGSSCCDARVLAPLAAARVPEARAQATAPAAALAVVMPASAPRLPASAVLAGPPFAGQGPPVFLATRSLRL